MSSRYRLAYRTTDRINWASPVPFSPVIGDLPAFHPPGRLDDIMTTVDAHAGRPSTASPPLAFPTTGDASGRTFGAEELAAVTRVL